MSKKLEENVKDRINHSHWDGKIYALDDNAQPVEITDLIDRYYISINEVEEIKEKYLKKEFRKFTKYIDEEVGLWLRDLNNLEK